MSAGRPIAAEVFAERAVESCPHRDPAAADQDAVCRLVAAVVGTRLPGIDTVSRESCRACCAGPVPDPLRLGPVVASLVARAADEVKRAGGMPGCDVAQAEVLRRQAHAQIVAAGPALARAYTPPRVARACYFLGEPIEPTSADLPGAPAGDTVRACHHPKHATTTLQGCLWCRDWVDHPRPEPRPLDDLLVAPPRQGPPVCTWAVGVRTAPRARPTLDWTLDSLIRAGWADVRIFEDSPTTIAARHATRPRSTRVPALGAWPNFHLGLMELVIRHPEADAYLMIEDDVLFYDRQNLRTYLERILWPSDPPGPISLYCPSFHTRPGSAWHPFEGSWDGGALAFVFPREAARRFVADRRVLNHRFSDGGFHLVAVDSVVGAWAHSVEVPLYFPSPSLVQHIGDTSTLWPTHSIERTRHADHFLGDLEPG